MTNFEVCERFVSINGEGERLGELSVFIRFKGCNLSCSYCDTKWANKNDAPSFNMTVAEICEYAVGTGVKNVTLTGGEPLLRDGMDELLRALKAAGLSIEVETNGAVDISPFCGVNIRPDCFTLDYKLPSSGMENKMLVSNFEHLQKNDCVKFVSGNYDDLCHAAEIIRKYDLTGYCAVHISPVFGKIEPLEIVEFMEKNTLNGVKLRLQIHKIIWDPDKRGV